MEAKMESTLYRDLHYVLERTGLLDLYPEKITRERFFELSDYSQYGRRLIKIESIKQLHEVFIYNLRFCHGNARTLQVSKERVSASYFNRQKNSGTPDTDYLHPMDVITAVFLCCDPIAKQDFVSLLWECKFAIPLLIQLEQLEPLMFFLWPLRSIIYTSINGRDCDKRVTSFKMPVISFVRFGEVSVSKSSLLNRLVCQSETEHSTFFHRDCQASTKVRSEIVNGMIETTFAPLPDIGDCMFLNLRGDMQDHVLQVKLMSEITNVFVFVCQIEHMSQSKYIIKMIKDKTPKPGLILLLTNTRLEIDSEDDRKITSFLESNENQIKLDVLPLKDHNKSDITEDIVMFIQNVDKQEYKIEDIPKLSKKLLKLDEDGPDYQNSLINTSSIFDEVSRRYDDGLAITFPLQGQFFQNWSSLDKELYRLKDLKNEDIQQYRDTLSHKKDLCREQQRELCLQKDSLITQFIELFPIDNKDGLQRQISLRMLNHRLADLTQQTITHVQMEYKDILKLSVKGSCNVNDSQYAKVLANLDEKMSNASISLPNFTKEIGQFFEAMDIKDVSAIPLKRLPTIAVQCLIDGYPLELMDGKAMSVPIKWVSAVLKQLRETLEKRGGQKPIKITVISILGIQSTGKSTLLNTMFGSHFAVSSGRCTRGVYLHLVNVSRQTSWANDIDYVLLVDTEGISALEYHADSSRERELATFILGLANTTIVNIMSENTVYLRDILPISVHAFLRMDLVGLDPRCVIAHHNVDRINIPVIRRQWNDLEGKLDEYTHAACKLERVQVRRFQDVVRLNQEKDLHCVSSYRQRCGNIEYVSKGYSEAVMDLLCNTITEGKCTSVDLVHFEEHTRMLWNAVKKDNFVYEFKNTIEAEARSVIDHHWCLLSWKLRRYARSLVIRYETEIMQCSTLNECNIKCKNCCKMLFDNIKCCSKDLSKKLKSVLKNSKSSLLEEPFKRWKLTLRQSLQELSENVTENLTKVLINACENKCKDIQKNKENSQLEEDMTTFIQDEIDMGRSYCSHFSNINSAFDKWMKHTSSPKMFESIESQMESAALKTLFEAFPSRKSLLQDTLRTKAIHEFNLSDFTIKDEYFSHLSQHVNDQKDLAQNVVREIIDAVTTLLQQRKTQRKTFDTDAFTDVLVKLKEDVNINKGYLATRVTFQIDLALCLVGHAIEMFKEIEEDNEVTTSERYKAQAKSRFQSIYDKVQANNKQRIESIVQEIEMGIQNEFKRTIAELLITELEKFEPLGIKVLTSKRTFLLYILLQLVKETDWREIKLYLLYPTGSMRNWICFIFDEFTGITKDTSERENVYRIANNFLGVTYTKISNILQKLCLSTENGDKWIDEFQKEIKSIVFLREKGTGLSAREVPYVKLALYGRFRDLEQDILKNAINMFYDYEYDHIKEQVTDFFLDNLRGCTEKCPNCNETCAYGQMNHSGSHTVLLHIPVKCMKRETVHQDKMLSCSEMIAKINESEREKQPKYCIWDTGYILTDNDSAWQYICSKFRHSDKNYMTEIPESWNSWKEEAELRKLEFAFQDI